MNRILCEFLSRPVAAWPADSRFTFANRRFSGGNRGGERAQAGQRVEIHATELSGIFARKRMQAAVFTLRVIFFEGAPGTAGKPTLQMDCIASNCLEGADGARVGGWLE